jgi:hypothetical protein
MCIRLQLGNVYGVGLFGQHAYSRNVLFKQIFQRNVAHGVLDVLPANLLNANHWPRGTEFFIPVLLKSTYPSRKSSCVIQRVFGA